MYFTNRSKYINYLTINIVLTFTLNDDKYEIILSLYINRIILYKLIRYQKGYRFLSKLNLMLLKEVIVNVFY